jgi:hypothetical protein
MELQTAIEILEYFQAWRLGKREDMIHEPKELTEALDIVLSEVKKFIRQTGSLLDSKGNRIINEKDLIELFKSGAYLNEATEWDSV